MRKRGLSPIYACAARLLRSGNNQGIPIRNPVLFVGTDCPPGHGQIQFHYRKDSKQVYRIFRLFNVAGISFLKCIRGRI